MDVKGSIMGLERTLAMMCEVSNRSPSAFLQCYPVLRLPLAARRVFERALQSYKRP
jgi:hypothetical protein